MASKLIRHFYVGRRRKRRQYRPGSKEILRAFANQELKLFMNAIDLITENKNKARMFQLIQPNYEQSLGIVIMSQLHLRKY
ncbi:Hypothetical predicted protein [Paramuricea clavata]|uniref:Uncharacterized protein n=1 Tax=Paramuricea clavata TaxID=317549 RepID=A0A6S7G128_PARCT|nr:Hypothetical predicted protein [Paramuricea clavata]